MTLRDTIRGMLSEDYRERFISEYWQTKIRYERLKNFCDHIEAAGLTLEKEAPKHDCPYHVLRDQQARMGEYLHILELRAIIESIELEGT